MQMPGSFREFYECCNDYEGDALYQDVLLPVIKDVSALMQPLMHLKNLRSSLPGTVCNEHLWDFFALSALNDSLQRPFALSAHEYKAFFTALGFQVFEPAGVFNPVLSEIVSVFDLYTDLQGYQTAYVHWSGLRFGDMIFSRAGVNLACNKSSEVIKQVAENSTLYFTNRRFRRQASDLSHGWGSNSRWRTAFCRNYVTSEYTFVNVDAKIDLARKNLTAFELHDLSLQQARELLLNRCFIQSDIREDSWPYDWKMAFNKGELSWPVDSRTMQPFDKLLKEFLQ